MPHFSKFLPVPAHIALHVTLSGVVSCVYVIDWWNYQSARFQHIFFLLENHLFQSDNSPLHSYNCRWALITRFNPWFCLQVWSTEWWRTLPAWCLLVQRSRSSLPQSGSTQCGSVAPSWAHSPPSQNSGSARLNMMSADRVSSIASASKLMET